ncbi:MAG: hypothetical protein ACK4KT_01655 [Thermaurantimonas sp.]
MAQHSNELSEQLDLIRTIVHQSDCDAEVRLFCADPDEINIDKEIYLLILSQKITIDMWFYLEYQLRKEFKGRFVKTFVVREINSGLLRIAYDCSVKI